MYDRLGAIKYSPKAIKYTLKAIREKVPTFSGKSMHLLPEKHAPFAGKASFIRIQPELRNTFHSDEGEGEERR